MLPSSPTPTTSENPAAAHPSVQTPEERAPEKKAAPLQEIFSSIQGEGVFVGRRQVFARFAHCHLKCAYCDTPMASADGHCHVETPPGSGEIARYPNPMAAETVADAIIALLAQARHHSISLTGGEPLLYHAFLRDLLPRVRPHAPVYLETSGTQPEFLAAVLPWINIVAMDVKLPSATHEPPQWENHARFYALAAGDCPLDPATAPRETDGSPARHASTDGEPSRRTVFVKLVFNAETTNEELAAVKTIVTDRKTPIILQPETSLSDRRIHIPPRRMLEIEQALATHFANVRLIPQTHKMLNVL